MGKMAQTDFRPGDANSGQVERKILEAMGNSEFQWRTVGSLAKELKLPPGTVTDTLEKSECFVKARNTNARGEPLFTTSSRYKQQTPLWRRLLNAGANTAAG